MRPATEPLHGEPVTLDRIHQILLDRRSVFVFRTRLKPLWEKGWRVYPFHAGALVCLEAGDVTRYPGAFLATAPGQTYLLLPELPPSRAARFEAEWQGHLALHQPPA